MWTLADVRHTLGRASETGARGVLNAQMALFVLVGIALVLTTLANTAANRRLTFGVKGPERVIRHQAQGLMVFVANLAVTVLRFVLMRTWIFAAGRRAVAQTPTG